jgi:hypothetical protein
MNERSFIVKSESDRELNSGLQVIFLIRRSLPGGRIELPTKGL